MAVQATPYVETALQHSSELFRRALQGTLPTGSAGGVVPATPAASVNRNAGLANCSDLAVTAPSSGMSVNVNPGQVIVPGSLGNGSGYGMGIGYGYPVVTTNGASAPTVAANAHANQIQLTTQGAYYCYNDDSTGQVSLTISAANPSNPRIDVVVAQVADAAYSGSTNAWSLAVVTGTAASSPTVPTLPASCIPLALVWVPTNASSIISTDIIDLRVTYNRNPFYLHSHQATGGQSWPASGAVNLNIDTIDADITGSGLTGTGAHFTAPVGGIYMVNGSIRQSAGTGSIAIRLEAPNGTLLRDGVYSGTAAIQISTALEVIPLSFGETVAVNCFNGGTATTSATSTDNCLEIALLSFQ